MIRAVKFSLLILLFALSIGATAQPGFLRLDTIRVLNGSSVQLKNPWAGGHNFVQISSTDLNFDGIKDLVVYDRTGDNPYDKLTCYINIGTPNQVSYVHAPQYEKKFPPLHDWMFLVDYNCDGKEDILTYHVGDITAWKNTSSSGNLQFTLDVLDIKTHYLPNSYLPLYVSPVDMPAFADVDHNNV